MTFDSGCPLLSRNDRACPERSRRVGYADRGHQLSPNPRQSSPASRDGRRKPTVSAVGRRNAKDRFRSAEGQRKRSRSAKNPRVLRSLPELSNGGPSLGQLEGVTRAQLSHLTWGHALSVHR